MKKKLQPDPDIAGFMAKIQEQLAVMDQKLDSFMTKSLTELAQARAIQKPPQTVQHSPQPPSRLPLAEQRPNRPMYAVVCFDCAKNTEIPFKPSGDRPVYCKECFAKRKSGNTTATSAPKPAVAFIQPPAPSVIEIKPPMSKKKTVVAKKSFAKKKVVAKKKAKKK